MNLLFSCAGLIILLFAGDLLVRGAVATSLRLGIPALIVSLTVVAFGTSAPELLIAIQSALEGAPGIALGNVIGSNTANILLVLGVPALVSGLDARHCDTRRSYLQMIGATLVFISLCFLGPLMYWHGIVLLVLLVAMILGALHEARRARGERNSDLDDLEGIENGSMPVWQAVVYLVIGLIGLPVGADLLVDGAQGVAKTLGVSDEVIGLTLVAIGTSLPELATTVMAAIRKQAEVAIGNVIGSNLLNILAIMGIASFFGPLPIDSHLLNFDLWVMLTASLVLAPFVFLRWRLMRLTGLGFIAAYSAYMVSLF